MAGAGDLPGAQAIRTLGADGAIVNGRLPCASRARPADAAGAGGAITAGHLAGGVALAIAAAGTLGAMS